MTLKFLNFSHKFAQTIPRDNSEKLIALPFQEGLSISVPLPIS
jgi:hypothetical protein